MKSVSPKLAPKPHSVYWRVWKKPSVSRRMASPFSNAWRMTKTRRIARPSEAPITCANIRNSTWELAFEELGRIKDTWIWVYRLDDRDNWSAIFEKNQCSSSVLGFCSQANAFPSGLCNPFSWTRLFYCFDPSGLSIRSYRRGIFKIFWYEHRRYEHRRIASWYPVISLSGFWFRIMFMVGCLLYTNSSVPTWKRFMTSPRSSRHHTVVASKMIFLVDGSSRVPASEGVPKEVWVASC